MQGTGIRFFQVKTEEVKFRVEIPVKIRYNCRKQNQEQNMEPGTEHEIRNRRQDI